MKVRITSEAEAIIRSRGDALHFQGGEDNNDGTWTIELERETIASLRDHALKGESLSDTIIRLCLTVGRVVQ